MVTSMMHVLPAKIEPVEEQISETIFEKTFQRIFTALKIFGFSPTVPSVLKTRDRRCSAWQVLSLCYGGVILLYSILSIIRTCYGMVFGESGFLFYLRVCIAVWMTRCFLHSFNVMKIMTSNNGKRSKLFAIVKQLDENIGRDTMRNCKKEVERYKRRSKFLIIIIFGVVIMSTTSIATALFIGDSGKMFVLTMLYPFQDQVAYKLLYIFMTLHMNVAWMAPNLLYDSVCDSLVLKLNFLEDKLASLSENLTVRDHISEIRQMYLKTTRLVGEVDAMFGPMVMFVYVFDIALFSLNLYISLYVARSFLEHFCVWFWILGALVNLLVVSFDASRVVEKGKEVVEQLQRLSPKGADPQATAELSLLLFHLSGEPIVMTIWSLIPLYKSIIVSVFISLITYFTLLLQFK
ncbi:uncharacterized protein LOC135695089 [Rhopilema esculentum]|uniref:uncharacterized protein LOC135695089 n=1 Tax=Rhopilema esculentum TaxID=499914 RepID=UPI0031D02E97